MAKATSMERQRVLGMRLTKARRTVGFTQDEVAERLGYGQTTVSRIETGDRRVDVFELRELARLYRITMESLTTEPAAAEVAVSRRIRRKRRVSIS